MGLNGVAAVARPGGQLDRFWVGPQRDLVHAACREGAWTSPDRLDVIALGRDGQTWHLWWDGSRWVPWEISPDR